MDANLRCEQGSPPATPNMLPLFSQGDQLLLQQYVKRFNNEEEQLQFYDPGVAILDRWPHLTHLSLSLSDVWFVDSTLPLRDENELFTEWRSHSQMNQKAAEWAASVARSALVEDKRPLDETELLLLLI